MKKIVLSLFLGLGLSLISTPKVKAINVDFTIPAKHIKFSIPNKIAYVIPAMFYLMGLAHYMDSKQGSATFCWERKQKDSQKAIVCTLLGAATNLLIYKYLNR